MVVKISFSSLTIETSSIVVPLSTVISIEDIVMSLLLGSLDDGFCRSSSFSATTASPASLFIWLFRSGLSPSTGATEKIFAPLLTV